MPGTVTVASKLPHGLVLQLQEPYSQKENVMGVLRDVTFHRFVGRKVVLKGVAQRADAAPNAPIKSGFALTHNVDADFWEAWLRQNADQDAVQKGLVFASPRPAEIDTHVRDHRDELSGFEPVNPSKMPEEFKRKIQTAEV